MERVRCNLCGADDPSLLHRKYDLDISRCRGCGLVYAGPRRLTPEESRARYSADFFEKEYLPALGVQGHRFDLEAFDLRYRDLLARLDPLRQLGTLLEVGCGAGFFLKAAERAGWKATGLEVMEAGARFARETLGLDVRLGTLEDAGLPAGSYDAVVLLDVIEHLHDPRATLARAQKFARVTRGMLRLKPALFDLITDETIVCRCEGVRAKDVVAAIADGDATLRGAKVVKVRTRAGMGRCQGRICGHLVSRMIAKQTGARLDQIQLDTPRPPVKPVLLGALAADADQ